MAHINPNLLASAASPIMEVAGWVRATPLPGNRPLIDLSQAAPALPPPLPIRERLADAALNEATAHFYGPVLGNDALRAEVAGQWSTQYAGTVSPDQVAITAGCNQAFCAAIASACGPGDAVMLPYPWYFNHKMWLDMAGIDCVPLPCGPDMLPDLAQARRELTPRVKALALVTPNNPTGAEYPPAFLKAALDLARETGLLLIVDETYRDFHSRSGPPHGLFAEPDWPEHLAHLYSFSKTFRLMGHRTGAVITGAERQAQIEKFLDTVTICASQMGQIAALHGLQNLSAWVGEQREVFASRRTLLRRLFASDLPQWTLYGAGAYFAWVSPPGEENATVTARRLLSEQSLLTLPGAMFLPEGVPDRALRVAFANVDEAGIRAMVQRLQAFNH